MGVLRYVHIKWWQVMALLVLTLVGAAAEMGIPTLLARMIDDGVSMGATGVIVSIAVLMAVLAIVGCIASFATTFLSARISTDLAADLRSQIFRRIQEFSLATWTALARQAS